MKAARPGHPGPAGLAEPLLPQHAVPGGILRGEDGYASDLDASSSQLRAFFDRPVPAAANPVAIDAHRRHEYRNALGHHPDRGAGYYEYSRARFDRASLVDTGRCGCAGAFWPG